MACFPVAKETFTVPSSQLTREQKRVVREHANPSDGQGFRHVAVSVVPLFALWWIAGIGLQVSLWITAAATLGLSVILMRIFCLMHECGHGSLFRTQSLNRSVGFFFGVATAMPQYVWSRHHHYHHQTNGNWDKYRGPLGTITTTQFEALSGFRQWLYGFSRNLPFAPIGGFFYLIFNPRFNWIRGTLALWFHMLRGKPAATFQTALWDNRREYWHQTANNVVLISLWVLGSWAIGPGAFFAIYLISLSLAGGVGIAMFGVQQNFEHSYASEDAGWDMDTGALYGTSYLILPAWLNWATANMAYHHVHHLAPTIPGYCLRRAHFENQSLFTGVTQITLSQIPRHLKCVLWDVNAQRIISVREYRRQKEAGALGQRATTVDAA